MPEVERHEAVAVLVDFLFIELAVPDVFLREDVVHLGHLGVEVQPFLGVVLHELVALCLLRDNQVSPYFRKLPSLKVLEVAPCQERRVFRHFMVVGLLAEDVLFLQGVALPKRLHDIGKHVLEELVLFRIGA